MCLKYKLLLSYIKEKLIYLCRIKFINTDIIILILNNYSNTYLYCYLYIKIYKMFSIVFYLIIINKNEKYENLYVEYLYKTVIF